MVWKTLMVGAFARQVSDSGVTMPFLKSNHRQKMDHLSAALTPVFERIEEGHKRNEPETVEAIRRIGEELRRGEKLVLTHN